MSRGPDRRQVLAGGVALLAGARLAAADDDDVIEVVIEDLVFVPEVVEARPGQTIRWVNRDAFAHTATVKGGWDIPIPPGETASHVVTPADAVSYYCRFHPNMTGEIRLVE